MGEGLVKGLMAARSPSAHLPDAVDVHIHAVVPAGPLQLVLLHPELEGLANITAPKPSDMSTERRRILFVGNDLQKIDVG